MELECKKCGKIFSDDVYVDDQGEGSAIASIRCPHCEYLHMASIELD
jgi:DNA-directed RNA polymerase subunit RPC12/RpoP